MANDLITLGYFTSCMAAGGRTLSTAEQTVAPQLVTAASRLTRKHCNRYFTQLVYDGLYTIDYPSKVFNLRQWPINVIHRVSSDPTIVLSINQLNTAANQRAYCKLVTTGQTDVDDMPLAVTGLACVRLANGTVVTNEGGGTLSFSTYTTVQSLANAVNALGNGWQATVMDGYAGYPTTDPEFTGLCYFRPIQSALPCLGPAGSAGLQMHGQDLAVQSDAATGQINLSQSFEDDPFNSLRFGQYLSTDLGDVSDYGGYQGIRVIYDAGLATVYEDVQQAVVEVVADMLNLCNLDQRLVSETDGAYSYTALAANAMASYALTPSARGKLSYYVNPRA
jgi:hypothetical protein